MKYIKMLGLAAVAAAALMAFVGAGTASAAQLTCTNPPGTKANCATGTVIEATSTHVTLHPPFGEITCKHSIVKGTTTDSDSGHVTDLTFSECGTWTVDTLTNGTLDVDTKEPPNGTLTGNNNEVTVEGSGFHCIFKTKNTSLGTVTGSTTTGGNAKLDIAATIPREGGRSGIFCGSTAQWTGSYTVTSPTWLDVD